MSTKTTFRGRPLTTYSRAGRLIWRMDQVAKALSIRNGKLLLRKLILDAGGENGEHFIMINADDGARIPVLTMAGVSAISEARIGKDSRELESHLGEVQP